MPGHVKRLEAALCDDADASLRQLEVRQASLHGVRSHRPEILAVHDGASVGDRPHTLGGDAELLAR